MQVLSDDVMAASVGALRRASGGGTARRTLMLSIDGLQSVLSRRINRVHAMSHSGERIGRRRDNWMRLRRRRRGASLTADDLLFDVRVLERLATGRVVETTRRVGLVLGRSPESLRVKV